MSGVTESKTFKISRLKVGLIVLGIIAMVVICISGLQKELLNNPQTFSDWFMICIILLSIVFLIYLGVWHLHLLGGADEYLRITPDGFQYSLLGKWMVPWSEVEKIELRKMNRVKVVIVHLRDVEKFRARKPNALQRFDRRLSGLRLFRNLFGNKNSIGIQTTILNGSWKEIYNLFLRYVPAPNQEQNPKPHP
ncbi:MAG TPA: STM3941 family protein [Sphingomonadales bacterium]|nr:STM3941 family protein [Sphingomonadales bacterium]